MRKEEATTTRELAMENLGQYLKQNREASGTPLERIAEETRIPLSSLHKLEANQFEDLPSEVFVRGFIRSYCRSIGVESAHALSLYHGEAKKIEPTAFDTTANVNPLIFDDDSRSPKGLRLSHLVLILIAVATFVIAFMTVGNEKEPNGLSSDAIINTIDGRNRR